MATLALAAEVELDGIPELLGEIERLRAVLPALGKPASAFSTLMQHVRIVGRCT